MLKADGLQLDSDGTIHCLDSPRSSGGILKTREHWKRRRMIETFLGLGLGFRV